MLTDNYVGLLRPIDLQTIICNDQTRRYEKISVWEQYLNSGKSEKLRAKLTELYDGFPEYVIKKSFQIPEDLHYDCLQEAYMALINAISAFDLTQGIAFTTYAFYCIKGKVNTFLIVQSWRIHVPKNLKLDIQRCQKTIYQFKVNYGETPDSEDYQELADMMNERWPAKSKIYSAEEVRIYIETIGTNAAISLDAPILSGDDDSDERYNFVASLSDDLTDSIYYRSLLEALNKLPERSRQIILMRQSMSLDEIGQRFGITIERVRQIEVKAMKDLRKILGAQWQETNREIAELEAIPSRPLPRPQSTNLDTFERENLIDYVISGGIEEVKPEKNPPQTIYRLPPKERNALIGYVLQELWPIAER